MVGLGPVECLEGDTVVGKGRRDALLDLEHHAYQLPRRRRVRTTNSLPSGKSSNQQKYFVTTRLSSLFDRLANNARAFGETWRRHPG